MTETRKLLLAAALIAAGFGIATLLGEPAEKPSAPLLAGAVSRNPLAAAHPAGTPLAHAEVAGQLRLIPDFSRTAPGVAIDAELAPPPLSTAQVVGIVPATTDTRPEAENMARSNMTPRAKLRNEAPRPVALDWQVPETFARTRPNPAPAVESPSQLSVAPPPAAAEPNWPAWDAPVHASWAVGAAPAIVASYSESSDPAEIGPIAPPPWPAPAESEGQRTHVIVDGDSLARLAGRYLDDPRRSNEIYEANRGLLADPDLLPIGVELVIPVRGSATRTGPDSPRSLAPRTVAVHAPAAGVLVPVRPVPDSSAVVPQARLTRPLPVE